MLLKVRSLKISQKDNGKILTCRISCNRNLFQPSRWQCLTENPLFCADFIVCINPTIIIVT